MPSSSQNNIVGWLDDVLKMKVKAPPEKGKANMAVIALLATQLGDWKAAIELISGQSAP